MQLFHIDDDERLFISPAIVDWQPILDRSIDVVVDLEGGLDRDVPTVPNQILYIYFPIYDEQLPQQSKLDAIADLGVGLLRQGHSVLSHCGMGFNRSALVAGLILNRMGMPGTSAVERLRSRRPGALFNDVFAAYLSSLP